MSLVSWKLEKHMCRCCHNEGSFKNLGEPCINQDEVEEIYCEMLQECLDITVKPVGGPLCEATFTICEDCILRLRDACSFKQQVLQCEQRFRDLCSEDVIKLATSYDVEVKQEASEEDITIEISKLDTEDDRFDLPYDDEDVKKTQIIKSGSKRSTKKPKAKEKAKPKKNTIRVQRIKIEEDRSEEAEKKGIPTLTDGMFTLVQGPGRKLYSCNLCERVFSRRDLFTQHYRHVHLKLRPKVHMCCYCTVRVPAHMRARHLEEAHGIPRPECNACGKKFAYPFQVIQHQKQFHMDEKMFPCPKCDLKFSIPSLLSRHLAKHSSVRPYKCKYCEKGFKWKKNLKSHVMIHLHDKRQVCEICQEAFVQHTSLKYHIQKKHPELV